MTGSHALIALGVLLLGWFAAGSALNVKRGNGALRWMQGGLPRIGRKATVRWIGTTTVDLTLTQANPPFEAASVVVFLEPRDLPWLWALSRARGRRDTLIVRAQLPREPRVELEVVDPESWSGRDILRAMRDERWSARPADGGLVAHARGEAALEQAAPLVAAARAGGLAVRRLSVRRREPHLQLHVDLPGEAQPADAAFAAICEVARLVSAR